MTMPRMPPLVIVSHDAYPAGSQYLALHLGRTIRAELRQDVEFVILGDGALSGEFREVGPVHLLTEADHRGEAARAVARRLRDRGSQAAIVNSVVSGDFAATLREAGFRVVSLVHELPGMIRSRDCLERAEAIARHAHTVVFPSRSVEAGLTSLGVSPPVGEVVVLPQGRYRRSPPLVAGCESDPRVALRARFRCPPGTPIVIAVGTPDARKGFDLFIDTAVRACEQRPDVVFIWVGDRIESLLPAAWERWAWSNSWHRIHVSGRVALEELDMFFSGADAFLLTSREDPYPSVLLDALDAGLPAIAFAGSGGATEILASGVGRLVPHEDSAAMAREVLRLFDDDAARRGMSEAGRVRARAQGSFRRYAFDVAALAVPSEPRISVVVPNYNYGRYLAERLRSVTDQSYPVYELIVLDDASADDSVEVASRFLDSVAIDHQVVESSVNSGSVFRQWLAGVERARGDLVWIAEADDLSDPRFLETLVPDFARPEVVMSYCESRRIDADAGVVDANYLDYVQDVGGDRSRQLHVIPGSEALATFMSVKNTIPNVSACLFRRTVLHEALRDNIEEISSYRVAGDWATYAHVLTRGSLAFFPAAYNMHRRHAQGVTAAASPVVMMHETLSMQRSIRLRHAPTDDWRRRAREYAQEVYVYLGLASASAPLVSQHPEFAGAFEDNA
jgi:glycosyltransferase involved in cell wall biosynthesis